MSNADIAELLAAAYASYSSQCETNSEKRVSCEKFFDYYKDNIQSFRHLMKVDIVDRELNG